MRRSPHLAAGLSALLPGLGQLYNGDRPKGVAVLSAALGVAVGILLALAGPPALRSRPALAMLAFAYPFLWLPAVTDAFRQARGEAPSLLARDEVWHTVLMLATIGPMALPLLWQSRRLSRRAKLWLTAAVIAIALAGVGFALFVGPILERQLGELLELLGEIQRDRR